MCYTLKMRMILLPLYFTDAPRAPDKPRVDKVKKDSCTISWNKPRDDGGCKIKGYVIEKKKKDDKDWTRANPLLCPDLTYTVPNLIEGDEYEFRVIAVNEVGDSPPSPPTDLTRIEEQPDQPRIEAGSLKDIIIRAGQSFTLNAKFSGFPVPTATWSRNDNEINIEKDLRIRAKTEDTFAEFTLTNAKREDAGQYKLQLKNKHGFDTAYCSVTVLDRPGPPENFRGEDVDGDALTLYWSPPKDDGGSPITNYILEKREHGCKAWSRVSGYLIESNYRVRGLTVGKKYDFRVIAENKYGTSDPTELAEPILARYGFDVPGMPGIPRSIDSSNDSITVSWTRPRSDGGSAIIGYLLEKRKKGDSKWHKVNNYPHPELMHRVDGLVQDQQYEFRVAAVNAAGQGPYSENSEPIYARPPPCRPKIDSSFSMRDIIVLAGDPFTLRVPYAGIPIPEAIWHVNGTVKLPKDDERIHTEINANFVIFLNKKAQRDDSGKYSLTLTNDQGSDTQACKVLVVDKPGPPQAPFEPSDTTPETCSLSWRPPLDDGGSPITNYIVERMDLIMKIWIKCNAFIRGCHYDVIGLEPNQ